MTADLVHFLFFLGINLISSMRSSYFCPILRCTKSIALHSQHSELRLLALIIPAFS